MKKEMYFKHLKDSSFIEAKNQYEVYNSYYKKNILRFLPDNKNCKILDAGCGLGHLLYFLKRNCYKNSLGIDINEENVNYCNSMGLNCKKGDLFKFFNNPDKFDIIIANNVLEHFTYKDIVKIIKQMHLRLNKNGKLLIIVPNCNNIYGITTYFSDITHKSPLNEKSFKDLIYQTNIKDFEFYNLYIYSGNRLIDLLIRSWQELTFKRRKIMNLLNGQKPFKTQSKNLLLVIKK
jgi:SAM-dependent methyltransferase